MLSNKQVYVNDNRSDTSAPIPDKLFNRVVRAVTDALNGYKTFGRRDVMFEINDCDRSVDNAKVRVTVKLTMEKTPNTLNYLANKYDQVANIGATPTGDDKVDVEYCFFTPLSSKAFNHSDEGNYPPLN